MRRREFIAAVGGVVLSRSAVAQQRRTPRIGVLWHAGSAEEEAVYLSAFLEGLKSLGHVDGQTVALEHGFLMKFLSVSLAWQKSLQLSVDVLVAVTRPAAVAAQRATKSIPIVFIVVPDPVGTGLVESLGHPGGNITGLTHIAVELTAKRLALFKEAYPNRTRVALLVNANDQRGMQRFTDEAQTAATALSLTLQVIEVRSLPDFDQAFERVAKRSLEGVVLPADGLFYQGRYRLAELALGRRIPLVVYSRETLEAGALMSYGADQRTIFRRAGAYVDRILKGEKVANLPVEQPTRFELLINLKTAKSLGITLSPTLLARADETQCMVRPRRSPPIAIQQSNATCAEN
jgi:putative ABC transport system substrate-binding protein